MYYTIHHFIHDALKKGESRKDIRLALLHAGWKKEEIHSALDMFADYDFSIPVPKRKPYLSAREAFLYLLMFLTLYISAFSFGTLLFHFITRWIPDPLEPFTPYAIRGVRMAVSSLIIAFPLYYWLSTLTVNATAKDPEKRASKIRKWLTYITLFITAGVIIVDLITLLFNLLNGELSLRFLLKVLAVFLIAGMIFGYYLWDLRQDEKRMTIHKRITSFAIAVITMVVLTVILGLYLVGSPGSERARRFDEQRVNDLREIASIIDQYYREEGLLPKNLLALEKREGIDFMIRSTSDPITGKPYGYIIIDTENYKLCATFDRTSTTQKNLRPAPAPISYGGKPFFQDWKHEKGYQCFSLKVSLAQFR